MNLAYQTEKNTRRLRIEAPDLTKDPEKYAQETHLKVATPQIVTTRTSPCNDGLTTRMPTPIMHTLTHDKPHHAVKNSLAKNHQNSQNRLQNLLLESPWSVHHEVTLTYKEKRKAGSAS